MKIGGGNEDHRSTALRWIGGTVLAISWWACAPAAPVPMTQPSAMHATDPGLGGDLDGGKSGYFPSKRFGLQLPLEDGTSWKIDDRRTHWLVAQHPSTSSTLLVRLWRDENRMNREKCEARARSWRNLPSVEGADLLEDRSLDLPAGFDTRVQVALVTDEAHDSLFGFALAFGGFAHKCFAYVYVTKADGRGADVKVADRLAKIVAGSLSKIRFDSDLAPDIDRTLEP